MFLSFFFLARLLSMVLPQKQLCQTFCNSGIPLPCCLPLLHHQDNLHFSRINRSLPFYLLFNPSNISTSSEDLKPEYSFSLIITVGASLTLYISFRVSKAVLSVLMSNENIAMLSG